MSIHQIQIRHDENEDRLLLRVSTTDNCEFRFWMTRRFTQRLWRLLVQMLGWDAAVRQQFDPETRNTVLDLQHEGYSRQANYAKGFEEDTQGARRLLLGAAPLVLTKARGVRRDDGAHVLTLQPHAGQGIDMTLDARLLHVFTRLLREQAAKTGWELDLALHNTPQVTAAPPDVQHRKLN